LELGTWCSASRRIDSFIPNNKEKKKDRKTHQFPCCLSGDFLGRESEKKQKNQSVFIGWQIQGGKIKQTGFQERQTEKKKKRKKSQNNSPLSPPLQILPLPTGVVPQTNPFG